MYSYAFYVIPGPLRTWPRIFRVRQGRPCMKSWWPRIRATSTPATSPVRGNAEESEVLLNIQTHVHVPLCLHTVLYITTKVLRLA